MQSSALQMGHATLWREKGEGGGGGGGREREGERAQRLPVSWQMNCFIESFFLPFRVQSTISFEPPHSPFFVLSLTSPSVTTSCLSL